MLALLAQSAITPAAGLALTLLYLDRGTRADVITPIALIAMVGLQGGLLIGEYAARSGGRVLGDRSRLQGGLWITALACGWVIVAVVLAAYLGLGGAYSAEGVVVSGIIATISLGTAVLAMPAVVLDPRPARALVRAVKTWWRIAGAAPLGGAYVALLVAIGALGPVQLLQVGLISASQVAVVGGVASWIAIAILGIPFWWTVAKLYVPPAATEYLDLVPVSSGQVPNRDLASPARGPDPTATLASRRPLVRIGTWFVIGFVVWYFLLGGREALERGAGLQ